MTVAIRIVDVTDEPSFRLIPPCADPGFDHRSCDYWEDADRGSKAARLAWLETQAAPPPTRPALAGNPFARQDDTPDVNPFAPDGRKGPAWNPFAVDDDEPGANPFAPAPPARPIVPSDLSSANAFVMSATVASEFTAQCEANSARAPA